MMEKNFRKVGIDEILGHSIYNDGEIAILRPSEVDKKGLSESIRLDMTMIILCTGGEGIAIMDDKEYMIKKNDLVFCAPNVVIKAGEMNVININTKTLCLTPEMLLRVRALTSNSWDFLQYVKQNPIVSLDDEQATMFCQYYDMLCSTLNRKNGNKHKEVVYSILTAFFYELFYVVETISPAISRNLTSADIIFQKYIDLLSSMYPRNRTVAYYADKLHVTPKYLSVVCKQIGGKTALHYINAYVNEDIRQQLTKTNKSIKEICTDLEFSNLSFFGKYVRRQFGVGPTEYRKNNKV